MTNKFYILNDRSEANVKLTNDDVIGYFMIDGRAEDGQIVKTNEGTWGFAYSVKAVEHLIPAATSVENIGDSLIIFSGMAFENIC